MAHPVLYYIQEQHTTKVLIPFCDVILYVTTQVTPPEMRYVPPHIP